MLISLMKTIIVVICVLMSVAFLTLLERKFLSFLQDRKGPNKVGYTGILQPFSDALKLLSKEPMMFKLGNPTVYLLSPLLTLSVSLTLWLTYPSHLGDLNLTLTLVFLLCCLAFSVYPILISGWASNSKFSLLGSYRAAAQSISYEVSLALAILSVVFLNSSYNMQTLNLPYKTGLTLISLPLALLLLISFLAETSRTPFDFSEGESELVSGFNTEYSSSSFVLFFLAEYSSILFMSLLLSILFLYTPPSTLQLMSYSGVLVVVLLFLWTRGTLPRLRYDKLMMLAWKSFLPLSLGYLLLFCHLPFLQ